MVEMVSTTSIYTLPRHQCCLEGRHSRPSSLYNFLLHILNDHTTIISFEWSYYLHTILIALIASIHRANPTTMSSNADSLVAKAEKKASSSGGWFSSSSSKYEEAADLFQQAANAYKVEKKWRESGTAFEKWVIDFSPASSALWRRVRTRCLRWLMRNLSYPLSTERQITD